MSLALIVRYEPNWDRVIISSGVTNIEISIATQVQAKCNALRFSKFTAPPNFYNTKMLCEELAVLLKAFPCNQWGGGTRIHPDGLIGGNNSAAHRERRTGLHGDAKPNLVNLAIVAKTGRDLLTLQEEQRGLRLDYLYQRVLNQVVGEIIVSVIPEQ